MALVRDKKDDKVEMIILLPYSDKAWDRENSTSPTPTPLESIFVYILWFNFILGFNLIFFCVWVW